MRHHLLLLVAVLSLATSVPAEETGALFGSVRTAQGTPLAQLVLVITGPSGSRRVVTGPEGRYRAAGLAPGEYAIAVESPGLTLGPDVRARIGRGEIRLDLTLSPAPVREQVVVSATRTDAALSSLGVSASVLDRERISDRESTSFLYLLQEIPGVAAARSGGLGLVASAFVRGGESRFARVLIDGVPVNEPGGNYNFGTQLPLELEQVEVVRGAASSLYGTDALAGVIHLVTHRADPGETPGIHAEAQGGSFSWRRFLGGTSGRSGVFDWNAGLLRLDTDNEEPNSAFKQTAGAASLGARLGDRTSARLILRGETGEHGTPGQTAFGRADLDASFERTDIVAGAQVRHVRHEIAHEIQAGLSRSDQLSLNPKDSGSFVPRFRDRLASFPFSDFANPAGFQNDTQRLTLGYQIEFQAGARNLVTAGADLERETGELGDRRETLLSPERNNVGAYVQDRIVLGDRIFATLGGRVERNDSFGTRAVPRAAVAWRLHGGEAATTFKASAGAGIKEPSFFESFGISFFAQGNPDLKAERSRTFDVGIEQRLLGNRLRAEATLYHHEYRDQIAFKIVSFTPFRGTYENLGKSRGQGLEIALEAAPTAHTQLWAQYTLLDGEILESASTSPLFAVGESLLRRPRHQASFSARGGNERFTLGATLVLVGKRADSDFAGLGLTENEGYARLDARARVRLGRGFEAFVASENLLNREYQEVLGYPALRRSIRAGVRYRTGSGKTP